MNDLGGPCPMKEVGIIGAGLGGLTSGALLSKKGYRVKVFEKEKFLGGRALTLDGSDLTVGEYKEILSRFDMWMPFSEPGLKEIFEEDLLSGYKLDLGFHLLGFIEKCTLMEILDEDDLSPGYSSSRFGVITPENEVVYDFNRSLPLIDKLRLLPMLFKFSLIKRSSIEKMQKTPIKETIDKNCKGHIKDALATSARFISTINDLEKISTAEVLGVLKQWGRKSKPTGYPIDGSGTLSEGLAMIIEKNGGEINPKSEVERISIEKGEAEGVVVDGEKIPFDLVISNLPVQDIFEIAPKKHFPQDYVDHLTGLKGSGSVCAYYALEDLDEDISKKPVAFRERDIDVEGGAAAGIIDLQTAKPEMGMAPEGEYLIQAYIICTPEEAKDEDKVKMLRRALDKKMDLLVPGFEDDLKFALYPTSYHLDGVAKTIDNEKPSLKTPVKGLYLVGDCIESTGIGMNCAVDSAVRLSKKF
ncbi:MAG: phytoene desaturase family protein [Candidatus Natronoplasma sp.]